MESYRTEEEQVEALRRWWQENGRSTIAAAVIAVAAGFGWQGWLKHQDTQLATASDLYQALLPDVSGAVLDAEQRQRAAETAGLLVSEFPGTTYAQFGALQLARLAVEAGDLDEAEVQLRWVLAAADKGGDTYLVAQLRLARVLASQGDSSQALAILDAESGAYQGAYSVARGDILLGMGREDEAREAYTTALAQLQQNSMGVNLRSVEQKLQSLSPVPARELPAAAQDGEE